MATVLYSGEPLNKRQDWANADGLNHPASGEYVQAFIKNTLDKKFGYLYFDEGSNQYFIFSDEYDFNLWESDNIAYSDKILGRFDAPAPATMSIFGQSNANVEILLGSTGNAISFIYYITDSSKRPVYESVSIRVAFSNGRSYSTTLAPSSTYNVEPHEEEVDGKSTWVGGNLFSLPIDEYLTAQGNVVITVTITGMQSQVTTSVIYNYTVTQLDLALNWDNTKPLAITSNEFNVDYTVTGGAGSVKNILAYIDGKLYAEVATATTGVAIGNLKLKNWHVDNTGKQLTQYKWNEIGTENNIDTSDATIYNSDIIFTEGRHSLQVKVYKESSTEPGQFFYSETLYNEFVVTNPSSSVENVYILYKASTSGDELFNKDNIEFNVNQYVDVSSKFIAISTRGNQVNVKAVYTRTDSSTPTEETSSLTINSNTEFNIVHQFANDGKYDFNVYAGEDMVNPQFSAKINVSKYEFGGQTIAESLPNAIVGRYHALNRTNESSDSDIWPNTAAIVDDRNRNTDGVLHNREYASWQNHSLILSNGAYLTIPLDLFSCYSNTGFTFEIDFETFSSQSDDAMVMDYSDPGNTSFIKITSTMAQISSKNGVSIKTNFRDGVRNKIAFVCYPLKNAKDVNVDDTVNYNLVTIFVNGVLDRAKNWGNGEDLNSDTLVWTNPTTKEIKIGNESGEVGVKIYDMRIYATALSPEQNFMNFVVDQGSNIPAIMDRNNILDSQGNIDFDLVKEKIPTALVYLDIDTMNSQDYKKNNTMYDMRFFDPKNRNLNFFVRNGWISCQGTSSMQYPTKNLRPYFNKTSDNNTKATILSDTLAAVTPNYNTEFWPITEYDKFDDNGELSDWLDDQGILPYAVNKKLVETYGDNAFHEIAAERTASYRKDLAKKYAKSTDIYYKDADGAFIMLSNTTDPDSGAEVTVETQIDSIINSNATAKLYISAYRPWLKTGMTVGSDAYWKYMCQLRYSGVKLFTKKAVKDSDGNVTGYAFKKAKALDRNTEYYGLGAYWRQYDDNTPDGDETNKNSGWTDRWTLKTDYAESSMAHNGGIGKLWGYAMRNVKIENVIANGNLYEGQDGYVCRTKSQIAVDKKDYPIDIRTSCDSKPVALFVKTPKAIDPATGKILYNTVKFAGQYNFMTDKSSIPLFGFEDIKDEANNTIFKAKKTYCFEFLNNGSSLAQGLSIAFDSKDDVDYDHATKKDDGLGYNIGKGRPIFNDFEPRWPEDGTAHRKNEDDLKYGDKDYNFWDFFYQDDVFGVETNLFESFWNWLNFTKPAVIYRINESSGHGMDGYEFSPYAKFESLDAAKTYKAEHIDDDKTVYVAWEHSGNVEYVPEYGEWADGPDKVFTLDTVPAGIDVYYLIDNINYDDVTKTINPQTIAQSGWGNNGDVYVWPVYGFDASNRFRDNEGNIVETEADNYQVNVYMKRVGNVFRYVNNFGEEVNYANSSMIDVDGYERDSSGASFANKTYMDYFEETMKDHLDLYKIAAYYVYIMRFGAVDQVVKNCMMTTEDGQHWYFINYDNDTTLGVRNDAILTFNWDFDRDTWDYTGNSYGYAGAKSVLWNNLSMSTVFIEQYVKPIDDAFYRLNILNVETVLKYLDEMITGTWPERMYNAQEEIKYLSTFRKSFEQSKFLQFLQGNRKSHRNWWVNNRWELYDSLWSTGSYSQKAIHYYLVTRNVSTRNPLNYLTITAASKYSFTSQSNNRNFGTDIGYVTKEDGTKIGGSFVELKPAESATFTMMRENALGDPMTFIGPQKIRVLNFRPGVQFLSSQLSLVETYSKNGDNKMTWVKEAGSMMTKLLIGNGTTSVPLTNISGLQDITSLEEVDIRNCAALETTPNISGLTSLHIFRASASNINAFVPASGALLYEVSLPDGIQRLTLNNVTFGYDPLEYKVYQTGANGDSLPYVADRQMVDGKLNCTITSGVYTTEKAFKYTSESGSVFDFQPTATLNEVTFNTVTGFNTKKFVFEWRDILTAAGRTLANNSLSLVNIYWNGENALTVDELFKFLQGENGDKFNFINLSGRISVKSGKDGKLSAEDYTRIKNELGDVENDPFSTGCKDFKALKLEAEGGIFYQAEGKYKEYTPTEAAFVRYKNGGANFYRLIRGDELKVKANIFPNTGKKYVYGLVERIGNNYNFYPYNSETNESRCNSSGVIVTTQSDGSAILKAFEGTSYTENLYAVVVLELKSDGNTYLVSSDAQTPAYSSSVENYDVSSDYDYYSFDVSPYLVYAKVENKVIPALANINVYVNGSTTPVAANNPITLTINEEDKEYNIRFDLGNVNSTVTKIDWTTATGQSVPTDILTISDPVFESDTVFDVKISGKIQQVTSTNSLRATLTFNSTDAGNTRAINATITINHIKPLDMSIVYLGEVDVDGNLIDPDFVATPVDDENPLSFKKPGNYKYKVMFSNNDTYNVQIPDKSITGKPKIGSPLDISPDSSANQLAKIRYTTINPEDDTFIIKIVDHGNDYSPIYISADIAIKYTDSFNDPYSLNLDTNIDLVYPSNVYLDYMKSGEHAGVAGINNIEISLLNNQGGKILNNNTDNAVDFSVKSDIITVTEGSETITKEVSVPYKVTFSDITRQNSNANGHPDDVTFEQVEVDGTNILRLIINPQNGVHKTVTISGKYKVSFDTNYDNAVDTNDTGSIENSFTIKVNYTVADAVDIAKLTPNQYYLVDDNYNYYKLDYESDNTIEVTLDKNNNINVALSNNAKMVGFGIASTTPADSKFIYMLTNSDMADFDVTLQQLYNSYTAGQINLPRANSGEVDTDLMYDALKDAVAIQSSKFYKIYNEHSNVYIPTGAELDNVLNSILFTRYENIINILNVKLQQLGRTYRYQSLYEYFNNGEGEAALTDINILAGFGKVPDTFDSVMFVLSSSNPAISASATYFIAMRFKQIISNSGNIQLSDPGLLRTGEDSAIRIYFEERLYDNPYLAVVAKRIRILPFLRNKKSE